MYKLQVRKYVRTARKSMPSSTSQLAIENPQASLQQLVTHIYALKEPAFLCQCKNLHYYIYDRQQVNAVHRLEPNRGGRYTGI